MIIVNAISGILYFFFYHPPTFEMKHKRRSKMQVFKDFDFIGCLLFTAGLLLFVMGLSWGGSLYAWKSGYVPCSQSICKWRRITDADSVVLIDTLSGP